MADRKLPDCLANFVFPAPRLRYHALRLAAFFLNLSMPISNPDAGASLLWPARVPSSSTFRRTPRLTFLATNDLPARHKRCLCLHAWGQSEARGENERLLWRAMPVGNRACRERIWRDQGV